MVARDGRRRSRNGSRTWPTGFNKSQSEYHVNAVYKGNYTEVMTGAIAAFRAKQQPHIVQVFEVGTATMMAAKGAIKPVYELMADAGEKFDPKVYLPAVTGYYTTADGRMLSLPLNSSTPVLYYNKDAFKKAGLDPNKPPRTWPEMGDYGKKIQAAGYPCGFSSQWQQWILLENYSAWHNVPIATKQNGFAGFDTELLLNTPLHVRHHRPARPVAEDEDSSTTAGARATRTRSSRPGSAGCSWRRRRPTRAS